MDQDIPSIYKKYCCVLFDERYEGKRKKNQSLCSCLIIIIFAKTIYIGDFDGVDEYEV